MRDPRTYRAARRNAWRRFKKMPWASMRIDNVPALGRVASHKTRAAMYQSKSVQRAYRKHFASHPRRELICAL